MKRKSNKVTNKTLKKEINYIYNLVANNKIAMNIIGDSFYNYLIMKGQILILIFFLQIAEQPILLIFHR